MINLFSTYQKLKQVFCYQLRNSIRLYLRRSVQLFVLCSAMLMSFCISEAQKLLTLDEAIATALQNNYDIQLSKNDSAVAALDYSYRNAIFLPRINSTLGANWSNNKQDQRFTNGTKREGYVKTNNYTGNVSLNWTLFDGMKMFATRDKAAEFIKLGELGIKDQIINTVALVINNYYAIVRQKQQLKAIEEQMSLSDERVKLSQRKLEIGVGAKPDVLQSKVDLNAQKSARLTQQTLIEQLKEQLNQSMNLAQNPAYEVIDTIPINMNLALGDIQNNIENTNPLIQITKKNIDIASLTLKERKAEKWPTVSFNSGYNFNRTHNNVTLNPALPLYNRNRGYNYGLLVNVPILNNRNNNRLIKQAELNVNYNKLIFDNQRSLLNLDVTNAFKDYDLQKKALELEETNILLAKENVDIALQSYRLGAFTFLQLREAQKSLEDAYNRLIAARYNAKLAEIELLRLKGEILK